MAEPAATRLTFLENGQAWPAQGAWTYEDYLRLPDDGRRYEVIRGNLYVAPAPNFDHQHVVIHLGALLLGFVEANDLGTVLNAPFDVILPRGLASPVEPDLLFIRKEIQPRRGDASFRGAPDLVVEVISPSSRIHDRRTKFAAYRDAGVRELWLIDPMSRTVAIYGWKEAAFVEVARSRAGEDTGLLGSVILPGFSVEVRKLFPR